MVPFFKKYAIEKVINNKNYNSTTVTYNCVSAMIEVEKELKTICQSLFKDKINNIIYKEKIDFNPKESKKKEHDFIFSLVDTLKLLFDKMKHLPVETKDTRIFCVSSICNSILNLLSDNKISKTFNRNFVEILECDLSVIKKTLLAFDSNLAPISFQKLDQFCKIFSLDEKSLLSIVSHNERTKLYPQLDDSHFLISVLSKYKEGFMSKNKSISNFLSKLKSFKK